MRTSRTALFLNLVPVFAMLAGASTGAGAGGIDDLMRPLTENGQNEKTSARSAQCGAQARAVGTA
jgi:hypothetical protein